MAVSPDETKAMPIHYAVPRIFFEVVLQNRSIWA